MLRHLAILSFLVLSLSAFSAHAQDDPGGREQAKVHFKKGSALYEAKDFQGALDEFQIGASFYSDPSFDYSIALCWWQLGNFVEAEKHAAASAPGFDEFGRPEPAADNWARLAAFRRVLKATEVANEVPPEPTVATTTGEAPTRGPVPAQTWVGGAMTVAGLGLLGWWGAVELSLGSTIDDYEAAAAANEAQSWQRLRGDIESKQKTARVLLFSGAGLTAVGGALLIWGLTSSGKGEPRATLHLSPTGAVVVWKF